MRSAALQWYWITSGGTIGADSLTDLAEPFFAHAPSSPLQRMIEPEEIASLVIYIASPLAAATNGAALQVDGGLSPPSSELACGKTPVSDQAALGA